MNSIHEKTDEIINSLNFNEEYRIDLANLIRPNEDPDILKSIQLFFNNKYSSSINDYLESINQKELDFFVRFQKYIPNSDSMNPHVKPYPLKKYFVSKIDGRKLSHLESLKKLLKKNNGVLYLIDRNNERGGILNIGEKGSGKTFSQNVWLHENYELLEKNKIFWVRLDASKLVNIWTKSKSLDNPNLITTKDYLLGQTVYIFAKHFIKEYPLQSKLFTEIAEILEQSDQNKIPSSNIKSKYEASLSSSQQEIFRHNASVNKIKTIIDYLKELERQISVYENLYKGKNKRTKLEDREYSTKSFFIDRVLIESQKEKTPKERGSKIIWNEIGRILTNFIMEHGYYIFYIIDGIDNINYYLSDSKKYKEKIINYLFDFPLKKEEKNKNELLLISLRDTTYEELKIHFDTHYHLDTYLYKDIQFFDKIKQDTEKLQKRAFEERIKFVFKKALDIKETFIEKVLAIMLEYHNIPDEKRWNSNIRCFLHNHLNLSKLITYRYYFAGLPKNFNIKEQIDTFENINFLLNGELFIKEKLRTPLSNKGDNFFNLFGYYDENDKPYYLIYTRLLQIVNNNPNINQVSLKRITDKFTYNPKDVNNCIDRFIRSGYIFTKYIVEYKELKMSITPKGQFALNIFFSNIHYLYNTSIDTLLPKEIVKELKFSPNNFAPNTYGKKYYSPYCIITGMRFLQFLIDYNNYELKKVHNRDKNFVKESYLLPINMNDLKNTISKMVENCYNDQEFKKIILKHFNGNNIID